jgi:hypothetical protein
MYQSVPDNFEFIQFLGQYIGHTLFVGRTILSINAITTLVEGSTPLDAINKIYGDTTRNCSPRIRGNEDGASGEGSLESLEG